MLWVYFNITLGHFLHDLTQRAFLASTGGRRLRDQLTFLHFNEWCKRQCEEAGFESDYRALIARVPSGCDVQSSAERERIFSEEIPNLTVRSLDVLQDAARYDLVLVDEGQDFRAEWWNLLRRTRKESGELWLVADETQDIYQRAATWTDTSMTGSGFVGPWARLKVNHRCPPSLIPTLRDFATTYLRNVSVDLPEPAQAELELSPTQLFWFDVPEDRFAQSVGAVIANPETIYGGCRVSHSDCTLLVQNHAFGLAIEKHLLERYGLKCCSVFGEDHAEQKPRKMAFWMGDARIKASTYESFKGWESRLLVMAIGRFSTDREAQEIYIGLSRLRKHPEGSLVVVINCAPELQGFGARTGWQCCWHELGIGRELDDLSTEERDFSSPRSS